METMLADETQDADGGQRDPLRFLRYEPGGPAPTVIAICRADFSQRLEFLFPAKHDPHPCLPDCITCSLPCNRRPRCTPAPVDRHDSVSRLAGSTPVLNEGRECRELIVERTCPAVLILGVPVHTRRTALVRGAIYRLDERTPHSEIACRRIHEQILEIAVSLHRPGGQM